MNQKSSKRIFLVGWPTNENLGLVEVAKEFQKQSHEIIYWTWTGADSEKVIDSKEFPGVIWHSHNDAFLGIPAKKVDVNRFPQPGDEIFKKLYETESTVLTMMNKKYRYLGVSERKQIYYDMVRYWYGILSTLKPDVIIHNDIPHSVYDFIIFSVSKLLNIKNIIFERNVYFDRLVLMADYKNGSEALEKAMRDNRGRQFSLADLREDMQFHYKRQMSDADPKNIKMLKDRYVGSKWVILKAKMIWRGLADFTFFEKAYNYFFGDNLKKEYESLASPVDLSKPFIYAPFSFQPERTTSPQGGVFVNQILMVEILAASVPPDWLIYVKEHPIQWLRYGVTFSNYRYRGFYKSIARFPNVRLVPMNTSFHELIRKSKTVATVGGSASWEALLRSKPALIFGYPWYHQCPGVFKVQDVVACKKAIAEIIGGFKVDQSEIINYLVALDRASVRAYFGADDKELSGISREENIKNLSRFIISEIETMSA